MCSTAGGTWSIFGLAGQEELRMARTCPEDVARSELCVGGDTATVPSGTRRCRGSLARAVRRLCRGCRGSAGTCGCRQGLRVPRLPIRPLAAGAGRAARGPLVAVGWDTPSCPLLGVPSWPRGAAPSPALSSGQPAALLARGARCGLQRPRRAVLQAIEAGGELHWWNRLHHPSC